MVLRLLYLRSMKGSKEMDNKRVDLKKGGIIVEHGYFGGGDEDGRDCAEVYVIDDEDE